MLFLSLSWFLNNMYKRGIVQFESTDACLQNIEQNNAVLLTNQDKSFMFLLSRTCCLLKASWCSWDMVQMDQVVNFVGSNATNQQWLSNNCAKSSYPELTWSLSDVTRHVVMQGMPGTRDGRCAGRTNRTKYLFSQYKHKYYYLRQGNWCYLFLRLNSRVSSRPPASWGPVFRSSRKVFSHRESHSKITPKPVWLQSCFIPIFLYRRSIKFLLQEFSKWLCRPEKFPRGFRETGSCSSEKSRANYLNSKQSHWTNLHQ